MANYVLNKITVEKKFENIIKELTCGGLVENVIQIPKYTNNRNLKYEFVNKFIGVGCELNPVLDIEEKTCIYSFDSKYTPFTYSFLNRLNEHLPEFEYYWIERVQWFGERVFFKNFQKIQIETFRSKLVNGKDYFKYYDSFGQLKRTEPLYK